MKAQNSIKKIIAALLSTAVILTASSVSGIPLGLNVVAEPADGDGTTESSEILSGGLGLGYHWQYMIDKDTWADSQTTWEYNPTTKTLTISGTGKMPDWNGTEPVKDNPQHWQNRPWNAFTSEIEHVVIENGVTSIGQYAFTHLNYNIDNGVDVDISESVKSIEFGAFYESYGLKKIVIPDTVEKIQNEVFRLCTNLKSAKLPTQLSGRNLGASVFLNCKSLESIEIPETLERIQNNTFKGCTSLIEVTIPFKINLLGDNAFNGCTSLNTVTFNGTDIIPALGNNVFENCPCAADDAKGLIIDSCAVLDDYKVKSGWNAATDYASHIDKTHHVYYTAESVVITEHCNAEGCNHTATATLSIPDNKTEFFYDDGNEIKPVINTYSDNWYGTDEKKPADTEIKYKNNTKVGTAEATLTILNDGGSYPPATSKIGFEIISTLKVDISADGYDGVYDGNSHSITVNVSGVEDSQIESIKYGTTEGTYDLTDNPAYTDVGEYTVYYQITLTDGSVKTGNAIVKITPKPITDSTVTVEVTAPANPGDDPIVTVKDGDKTLTENADYTVTTTETTDTNTGKTTITVNVMGKGNYKDTVTKSVEIDSGNNPGSGDNPGSGGGSNPGGNTPGSGDNPGGNTSGDNPGSDDNSGGNTSDDNPSSDDNSGGNTSGDNPGGDNPGSDDNSGGVNPGGNTSGGDIPDDNSSDDSNSSDNSSETDENNPNKPINPGNVDDSGDVLDISRVPDTSSADNDNQNPITGNPMGKWVWILMSAAGATGIAVMKSKSNRKKN